MTTEGTGAQTITEHELEQCQRANQTGRQPVVFVHGLWLLPSSWDRWKTRLRLHTGNGQDQHAAIGRAVACRRQQGGFPDAGLISHHQLAAAWARPDEADQ